LPVAALALMADLAGVGPYRWQGSGTAAASSHDLVLHVVRSTLGQWVRVHLETPVLAERSAIGRLSLAAGDGSVLAIAQQACSVRSLPD
jgi:acyl-CoA thioesterase